MKRYTVVAFTLMVLAGAASVAGPESAAGAASGRTFSWGAPQHVVRLQGDPDAISCTSGGFCAAGDRNGAVLVRGSQGWGPPRQLHGGTAWSISCVSSDFCMELGFNGTWSRYDGSTWSAPQSFPLGEYDEHVSCVSSSFCVMTAGDGSAGEVRVFNGLQWSDLDDIDPADPGLATVDCTSTTFCIVGDFAGNVLTFDGQTWSAPTKILNGASFLSISCRAAGSCTAIDSGGAWLALSDGVWSAPSPIAAGFGPTALSCEPSGFCLASDGTMSYTQLDGGTWSGPQDLPTSSPTALACTAASSCTAVQRDGDAVAFSGGRWRHPSLIDPERGGLTGISCSSSAFCAIWDQYGNVYTSHGKNWSAPRLLPAGYMKLSVACPVDGVCLAVGGTRAWTYSSGQWDAGVKIDNHPVTALSCASASFCVAGDRHGDVVSYNGLGWTAPAKLVGYDKTISSVSCPDASFCMVSNIKNAVSTFDGAAWGAWYQPEGQANPKSVSCTSSTFCMAAVKGNRTLIYDGSTWAYRPMSPGRVSCVVPSFCVGVAGGGLGDSGSYHVWDGSSWSAFTPLTVSDVVSCFAVDACDTADWYGDVSSGKDR